MNIALLLEMAAEGAGQRVALGSRSGGLSYCRTAAPGPELRELACVAGWAARGAAGRQLGCCPAAAFRLGAGRPGIRAGQLPARRPTAARRAGPARPGRARRRAGRAYPRSATRRPRRVRPRAVPRRGQAAGRSEYRPRPRTLMMWRCCCSPAARPERRRPRYCVTVSSSAYILGTVEFLGADPGRSRAHQRAALSHRRDQRDPQLCLRWPPDRAAPGV